MQTTGLARRTIGRLYEGDALAAALRDARARTLQAYGHLDVARVKFPCIPLVNPALWELSHIAWFQEFWCLRYSPRLDGPSKGSSLERADELLNSATVPHDSRWHLDYPPAPRLLGYMESTLHAALEALARTAPENRYFFALALLHEDMHAEALLMTLQTLGLAQPPRSREPPPSRAQERRDIAFPGGAFAQGTPRECPDFVFDNEKWAHAATVAPFAIASTPVTQGEFRDFIEEGGYRRREFWTGDGWRWRESQRRESPRHWKATAGEWTVRRFDRWIALETEAPMIHVTLHEALAYCRWAGRRLPTEAEWEYAARSGGGADRFPWGDEALEHGAGLDLRHCAPSSSFEDPAPSRSGLRQLLGGVWEWTSTAFLPYPGFRADPYREYSEPWFGNHYVLRGGSFATRSRLVHNRFRNFYVAERDDVFNGFRTCAVERGCAVS